MNAFATISTTSHINKAIALKESLDRWAGPGDPEAKFFLLVVDGISLHSQEDCAKRGIELLRIQDIADSPAAQEILDKYSVGSDEFRWSLKPVLLAHLLRKGIDRAIYLDNDLFFFSDSGFLFEELSAHSVLLCPHWRISDPRVDPDWFETNFKDGLYNAGFVGANQKGLAAMEWWAKACAYKCEKDPSRGLFDDQRYLDLLPAHFEQVGILQHRGCNVAYWNRWENRRVKFQEEVLINGKYPIVFVHFTADLIASIEAGTDPELSHHLKVYLASL